MGNAPAPQMPQKYLEYLKSRAFGVFDAYGEDEGWNGIPPVSFLGAIVANESGGQNLPRNNWGAIGPMQMTSGGLEADYWRQATGETLTDESLTDPDKNTDAGIFGLGQRMKKRSFKDWGYAGVEYFGGHVAPDGSLSGGDVNETAQDYYNNIYATVQSDKDAQGNTIQYDGGSVSDNIDAIKTGKWFVRGSTDGAKGNPVLSYNDISGFVSGTVNDVKTAYDWTKTVGDFLSNPNHAIEVIGLCGMGLMLVLVGMHGVLA